jgi:hypothetical protein
LRDSTMITMIAMKDLKTIVAIVLPVSRRL